MLQFMLQTHHEWAIQSTSYASSINILQPLSVSTFSPEKETMQSHHQSSSSSYNYVAADCSSGSTSFNSQPSFSSIPSLTNHHYDSAVHHHCVATLEGQSSYTSSIALAGKFLYTGSSDKEIRLWRRNSLASDFDDTTTAGNGAVKALAVLSNKLFSAHQDHKIRVWKIDGGEDPGHHRFTQLATLPTVTDRALKMLIPKNHVQIRRHKKCTWVHHVDTVSALALSGDQSLLYSVSWDRTIKIWRTTDYKCLESIKDAHDDAINALALSIDGIVYTGSADKTIKVWRRRTEEETNKTKLGLVATLERHNSGVNALALNNDGSVLYSGACDRSILVWERDGGEMVVVGALRGHGKAVLCLVTAADLVFSGSADKTVRIWRGVERSCYSCVAVLEGHGGPIKCLAVSGDHQYGPSDGNAASYLLYSGSLDCDVKVWQILVPHL